MTLHIRDLTLDPAYTPPWPGAGITHIDGQPVTAHPRGEDLAVGLRYAAARHAPPFPALTPTWSPPVFPELAALLDALCDTVAILAEAVHPDDPRHTQRIETSLAQLRQARAALPGAPPASG